MFRNTLWCWKHPFLEQIVSFWAVAVLTGVGAFWEGPVLKIHLETVGFKRFCSCCFLYPLLAVRKVLICLPLIWCLQSTFMSNNKRKIFQSTNGASSKEVHAFVFVVCPCCLSGLKFLGLCLPCDLQGIFWNVVICSCLLIGESKICFSLCLLFF